MKLPVLINTAAVWRSIKELDQIRKPPAVIYEWDIIYNTKLSRRKVKWAVFFLRITGNISATGSGKESLGRILKLR